MSLTTIKTVINDIIDTKDDLSAISENIKIHIDEYYKLKSNYYEFLLKHKEDKFEYSISSKSNGKSIKFRSNYPLQFKEKNGCYIIEVIDDVKRNVIYRKTIYINQVINLKSYIEDSLSFLSNKKYNVKKLLLTENINNIRKENEKNKLLYEKELITKQVFEQVESELEEKYKNLKISYTQFKDEINNKNIELQLVNKILNKNLEEKIAYFNKSSIRNTYYTHYLNNTLYNILIKTINDRLSDKRIIYRYYVLNRLLYQKPIIYEGNICTDDSINVYIITKIQGENVDVLHIEPELISNKTINKKKLKIINGLHNLLKESEFTTDLEYYPLKTLKNYLEKVGVSIDYNDYEEIFSVENIIDKDVYLKPAKTKISYLTKSHKKPAKKIVKQKKQVMTKSEEVTQINKTSKKNVLYNLCLDKFLLEGDNTVLSIIHHGVNRVMISEWLGSYKGESIDKELYNTYGKYNHQFLNNDWRQKLSYNYITYKSSKIIPIIIDGLAFSSVKHFIFYSMFVNNPDLEGDKLIQHNKHASKFLLSYEGEDGLSHNPGDHFPYMEDTDISNYESYEVIKNWDSLTDYKIEGNRLKYSQLILLKGLYAKFLQNNELRNILLATKDAKLINYISSNEYRECLEYMYIRYLLKNKYKPQFYENYESDNKQFLSLQITKESVSLDLKTEVLSKKVSSVGEVSGDRDVPLSAVEAEDKVSQLSEEAEALISHHGESRVDVEKMSQEEIISKLTEKVIKESQKEAMKLERLSAEISQLEQAIKSVNKSPYHVPPDGDCLYYSLVEILKIKNIFPMNFKDGEEEGQYSKRTQYLDVSLTEEVDKRPIHKDASIEIRKDIASKFDKNFIVGEKQSDEIETLKIVVANDITLDRSDEFNGDVKTAYIDSILNTNKDGGKWGGELEIQLASALYNINIHVLNSSKQITTYNHEKYSKIFPNGPKLNQGAQTKDMDLGYFKDPQSIYAHYIGLVTTEETVSLMEEQTKTDEIVYYYRTINVNDVFYNVALFYIEDKSKKVPIGIYDEDTKIITEFDYDDELHTSILETFEGYENKEKAEGTEYMVSNESIYNKLIYFRDTKDNKIYNIENIEIGLYDSLETEDGDEIPIIEFNT